MHLKSSSPVAGMWVSDSGCFGHYVICHSVNFTPKRKSLHYRKGGGIGGCQGLRRGVGVAVKGTRRDPWVAGHSLCRDCNQCQYSDPEVVL